ncbi:uncharacterized protein BJX67DRAFT_55725 [Aspergillus lucknowensis]|uniref:Uncharacterized protein n=1 Tax=Aspergillus lucknowensis TaxID=176173 RepID=A0ABR4LV12_9EURO
MRQGRAITDLLSHRIALHRDFLRFPAESTIKMLFILFLGPNITPIHLLVDSTTKSALDLLSNEELLMLCLVTWHFNVSSATHQLLSQLRGTPGHIPAAEAFQDFSSEPYFLLSQSLEDSGKFDVMCGILYKCYNTMVENPLTRGNFTNELQRLLGYLEEIFQHCLERVLLNNFAANRPNPC